MMHAIAAPAAAGPRFTPDQIFGLLLYRELGKTVGEISLALNLPETVIDVAMAEGEAGTVERAPAANGNGLRLAEDRRNRRQIFAEGGAGELFLPRWQRAVLRALARNDGVIGVAGAHALRSTYVDGVDAGMEALHAALRSNCMSWVLIERQGEAVYQIDEAALARLRALIANRWQEANA